MAVGVAVLTARGVLTTRTRIRLREGAHGQLTQVPRLLVLDLAQLTTLDNNSVDVLVDIAYEAGEADIGLCLVVDRTPGDVVTGPLTDADVLTLFEIHPKIAGALDVLG